MLRRIKAIPAPHHPGGDADLLARAERCAGKLPAGVNAYIVKPVDFEQFTAAARQIGWFWLLLNQAPRVEGR
jgi:hypothetical protein